MIKVKLADLIDAIEFRSDLGESFVHLKRGDVCFVSNEIISALQADEHPTWADEEEINLVKQYLENPSDFMELPGKYDVNEYQMMEDFVSTLEDEKIAGQLLIALRGRGAFRRFKDSVIFLGFDKEWYKFRDERYKQFVVNWCEDNGVHFL